MSYLCQSRNRLWESQPPRTNQSMTFEVVKGAFKRGQQKLFDSRGYLYCVKRRRNAIKYRHCSFHGKSNHCPASVIQHPEGSTVGVEHNHAGEVGLPETAKLTAAIKRKATWSRYRWLRERRAGSISKSFRKCSCWGVPSTGTRPLREKVKSKAFRLRIWETGLRMVPLGD